MDFGISADSTQWQRAQGPGLRAAMAQGSGLNMYGPTLHGDE